MAKTVLKVAAVAGFVALSFVPAVGQALQGAIVGALGGTIASLGIAATIVGVTTLALTGLAAISLQSLMKPKIPGATLSRQNLSFDANASRKIMLGSTPANVDASYQ